MAPGDARLGVAVSGGADSVALLDILSRLGFDLHVLHVNHRLRGAESDADEHFVRSLAAARGLPVEVFRAAPPPPGENLEQALRRIRYAFFHQARRTLRLERIATGHTLSDQAETLLMRLLRGAGARGLSGIHPVTRHGVIRPLLEVSRADIRAYLDQHSIRWREDSSNASLHLRRNHLRAHILPLLAQAFNPSVEQALARAAALAWEDELDWQRRAAGAIGQLGPLYPPFSVETSWLLALGPALGRRVIRHLLAAVSGSDRRLAFHHLDQVWRLASASSGAGRVRAPGAMVCRSLGWLRFDSPGPRPSSPSAATLLHGCGQARLGPWLISVAESPPPESEACYAEISEFDPEVVTFPLLLRFRRPGDRFHPSGRSGPIKVKDLLQRAGVPSWERAEWPMVESGGRLLWCRGFGPAAWARPGPAARRLWLAAVRSAPEL